MSGEYLTDGWIFDQLIEQEETTKLPPFCWIFGKVRISPFEVRHLRSVPVLHRIGSQRWREPTEEEPEPVERSIFLDVSDYIMSFISRLLRRSCSLRPWDLTPQTIRSRNGIKPSTSSANSQVEARFRSAVTYTLQGPVVRRRIILALTQGPVPRKMVKFYPGLSEILSTVFLLRACNSSLQNTVEPLLRDTVMIYTKCFYKQCIGRYKYKKRNKILILD